MTYILGYFQETFSKPSMNATQQSKGDDSLTNNGSTGISQGNLQ